MKPRSRWLTLFLVFGLALFLSVHFLVQDAFAATGSVTYDYGTNGGVAPEVDLTSLEGVKNDWTFVGWNTNENATEPEPLNSMSLLERDVKLFAVYMKTLKATFRFLDGSEYSAEVKVYNNSERGEIGNPPEHASDGGWVALGWSTSPEVGVDPETPLVLDVNNDGSTFYGLYERRITLRYDANGGSFAAGASQYEPPSKPQYVNSFAPGSYLSEGFEVADSGGVSRQGYEFVCWVLNSEDGPRYDPGTGITIDEDSVLYAVWEDDIKLGMYYFGKWTPEPASGLASIKDERLAMPKSGYTYIKNEAMTNYVVEFELTEPRVKDNAWAMVQFHTPDEVKTGDYKKATQAVMFRANLNTADDIRYMVDYSNYGGGVRETILEGGPVWGGQTTLRVRLEVLNGMLTVRTKSLNEDDYTEWGSIPMGTDADTQVGFATSNVEGVSFDNVRLYQMLPDGLIWDPMPVWQDTFEEGIDNLVWANANSLSIDTNGRMILPIKGYTWIDKEAMTNYVIEFELDRTEINNDAWVMIQFRTPDKLAGDYRQAEQAVMFRANKSFNSVNILRYMVDYTAGGKVVNETPLAPGSVWNQTFQVRLEVLNGEITIKSKDLSEDDYVEWGRIPLEFPGVTHVATQVAFATSNVTAGIGNVSLYQELPDGTIWDPVPVWEDTFEGGALDELMWGNANPAGVNSALSLNSWDNIKPFAPERQPLPDVGWPDGWYDSRDKSVMEQHLDWMADYGIDFSTFCWYWKDGVNINQRKEQQKKDNPAVYAYLEADNRSKVSYSLLWCNHNGFPSPKTMAEWEEMVDYWVDEHFTNPEYLKIDGKPVLFIFSPNNNANGSSMGLSYQAGSLGTIPAALLESARNRVREKTDNSLDGIYFVLCIEATYYWTQRFVPESGVDAITGYSYQYGVEGGDVPKTPVSHSFAGPDDGLDGYYQMQWNWILNNLPQKDGSNIPYFVPMTAGWDHRPWGASSDPFHDNSKSTPQEFENHLREGYRSISENMDKTKGIGMFYAWNEFGEGGIIEPTVEYQFEYLESIRRVFRQ